MAVRVEKEPSGLGTGVENCVLCHQPTQLWWGSGCAPLCDRCAQNVTDSLMVKISLREHLGPIPPELQPQT